MSFISAPGHTSSIVNRMVPVNEDCENVLKERVAAKAVKNAYVRNERVGMVKSLITRKPKVTIM